MPPFAVNNTNLPSHDNSPAASRPSSPGLLGFEGEPDLNDEEASFVKQLALEVLKLGRKRKHSDGDKENENTDDTGNNNSFIKLKTLHRYGRDFSRLGGDPWVKLDVVIQEGIRKEGEDSEDEDDSDQESEGVAIDPVEAAHLAESWEILCKSFPSFRETMIKFSANRGLRNCLAREMAKGFDNTRSNDTTGLKKTVGAYLLLDTNKALDPPLPTDKNLRGFHHLVAAQHLCPLEYPATEETIKEILSGSKRVTANHLPHMLYPDDREFDENDLITGLMFGHYPLRVAKHIFIGPSSALQGPGYKKGRRGNASLMGMSSMTPFSIAYATTQAHFAISSATEWTQIDGSFDYKTFYWNIVAICRGDDGADIIKHFNQQLFGFEDGIEGATEEEPPAPTSMDLLLSQRSAKRRRVDAAEE